MKNIVFGMAAVLLTSFSVAATRPFKLSKKAIELAKNAVLIDTHIDVPYRLHKKYVDVTKATKGGDFDYPRAVEGGLNVPFMSVYIPAHHEEKGTAKSFADEMIKLVEKVKDTRSDKFRIITTASEAKNSINEKDVIAMAMGMENGSPIEGKLENLHYFYKKGIRYITLTHSLANHISDSSYDLRRKWNGLSPFGKKLVLEMNKVGMMVDISHVSDDAFYQAVKISKAPVIASHSSLRKFTPGFERNMSDDMVKALAKNGGVIQINFGSSFVSSPAMNWYKIRKKAMEAKKGIKGDKKKEKKFKTAYQTKNPFPFADLKIVLDHIDHVVKIAGIDYVGIGSDYDGVGDSLPQGLKDVSSYPNLVQGLLDRGYSDENIKKILGGNFLRVWKKVEEVAQASK